MIDYVMRMFSWKGCAGRKEFFGFWIMPLGIFFAVIFLYNFWGFITGKEVEPFREIFLVGALVLLTGSIHLFAAIRRLRHVGYPTWWASVFLAPGISWWAGFFTLVLEIILLFVPALSDKKEDSPSYLKTNLILGLGGFLIVGLIFGSGVIYRQVKIQQIKSQQKQEVELLRKHYSNGINTSTQIPADIMVPKEPQTASLARTKPMPMQLPAPKLNVIAQRVAWKKTSACDSVCQQVFSNSSACTQYLSADGQARLCIHTRYDTHYGKAYHQLLVNPQGLVTEHIVFNDVKRPILLGHLRENKLKELFYGFSADETYFFHLAKDGFVPDFTNINHLPTAQYADISISLTDRQTWVPVDFDEQGRSSRSTSERELTTPWSGLNVSSQFLP